MDMNGCKALFGRSVVVATTVGKEFIGTLEAIPNSASSVILKPLAAAIAANYAFAINGVNALDVAVISFMQDLGQPH